jgi:hypothetical protein
MADALSEKVSSLFRQANFVGHGLSLVAYGRIVFFVARFLLKDPSDIGIYTTLICLLLYYVFGISFTINLIQSLMPSYSNEK